MPFIIFLIVCLILIHIYHKKCKACRKNRREREAQCSRSTQQTRDRSRPEPRNQVSQLNERRNEVPTFIHAQVHRPTTPSAPSYHSEENDFILLASDLPDPQPVSAPVPWPLLASDIHHQTISDLSPRPSAPQRLSCAEDLPPSYNDVMRQLKWYKNSEQAS